MTVLAVPGSARTSSPAVPLRPHLPGYLLLAGTQRLRRSQSLKILREIERAPFAPPEEVRASQFRRLSALLAHAEAKVPYYRELFRSLGIRSRDIRTLGRLRPLTHFDQGHHPRAVARPDSRGRSARAALAAFQRRIDRRAAAVLSRARLHGRLRRRDVPELPAVRLAARRDDRLLLGQQRAAAADVARRVRAAPARAPHVPVRSVPLGPGGDGAVAAAVAVARRADRVRLRVDGGALRRVHRELRAERAAAARRVHDRGEAVSGAARRHRPGLRLPRVRPVRQQRGAEHRRRMSARPHARERRLRRPRNRPFGGPARRADAAPRHLAVELRDAVHPLPQRGLRRPRWTSRATAATTSR